MEGLKSSTDFYSGKISTKSKFYVNQSFNSNAWKEVRTTEKLHQIILDESSKKKRIVKDCLKLRVSLGYVRNIHPVVDTLDDYFEEEAFAGFSQDPSLAMSPEMKKNSSDRRTGFNNANDNVETLLMRMFADKESCLHHGFLLEHRMVFSRSLRRMIKGGSYCDNQNLFDKLQDSKKLLTQAEVDQYLIEPYYQEGRFDLTKDQHPEKGKYPPKNRMMQCPQLFDDWERILKARGGTINGGQNGKNGSNSSSFGSILERLVSSIEQKGLQSVAARSSSNQTVRNDNTSNGEEKGDENDQIEFITFKCKWDPVPICIVIEDEISSSSTMRDLLLVKIGEDPCINDEFELNINSSDKLYFRMKIGNEYLVLRKSQFLKYTIHKLCSIKNITIPITIDIVRDFKN